MTEQTTPYTIHVNGHTDTGEPLDRLDNRDLSVILHALSLHYTDKLEAGASIRDLEHLSGLSRRLADVSRTWVAEEATG